MHFVFVSHGELSKSILKSAEMIVGSQEDVSYIGLYPNDEIGKIKEQLEEVFKEKGSDNIICFTDLFSGSPFNAVVSLMEQYPVKHITGMNLPLVLEAFMLRTNDSLSIDDVSEKLISLAPSTFIDVNKYILESL